MHRPTWKRAALIAATAAGLLMVLAAETLARVGGGESWGGGGGGGGGGFGGGSGGGGGDGGGLIAELVIRLVIFLVIRAPIIGIPLLLGGGAFAIYLLRKRSPWADNTSVGSDSVDWQPVRRPRRTTLRQGIAQLRAHDPLFSKHLFLDFCTLLYTRVQEARGGAPMPPVEPYLAPDVLSALDRSPGKVSRVIVGATTIDSVRLVGKDRAEIKVTFEANYREEGPSGTKDLYTRERWTFDRRRDVPSKTPETIERLGCPSCGAAADLDVHGRCTFCQSAVNQGDFAWVTKSIQVLDKRNKTRVEVSLGGGGVEPGTANLTAFAGDFPARKRAFESRYPDFTWQRFLGRARTIFMELQEAWSTLEWERARPFETDHLFQSHRYWIERYRDDGLRNALEDIVIERVTPCRIEPDPFYETITLRIFASMRDFVVDGRGRVVGGNPSEPRHFSEYWTFIRRAGRPENVDKGPDQCPSCGAALKVDAAAICSFCGSKVASGDFDWVVSLIEQDEVYQA